MTKQEQLDQLQAEYEEAIKAYDDADSDRDAHGCFVASMRIKEIEQKMEAV